MRIVPYTQLLILFVLLSTLTSGVLWVDQLTEVDPVDTGENPGIITSDTRGSDMTDTSSSTTSSTTSSATSSTTSTSNDTSGTQATETEIVQTTVATATATATETVATETFGEAYFDEDDGARRPENIQGDQLSSTIFPIDTFTTLILFYASVLTVLGIGFRLALNTPSVQRLINTALRLSGFSQVAGLLGRSWKVDDQFILTFDASSTTFAISLPETAIDPREFGFRPRAPHVTCSPEQLQLTLLSVRHYLYD